MNIFINTQSLEYPLYEGDLRLLFSNISESMTGDTFPCPDGFALVEEVTPPEKNTAEQYVIELSPEFVDGRWRQVWEIRTRTQQELDQISAFFARLTAIQESQQTVNKEVPDVIG